jgi:hypothetical protein
VRVTGGALLFDHAVQHRTYNPACSTGDGSGNIGFVNVLFFGDSAFANENALVELQQFSF